MMRLKGESVTSATDGQEAKKAIEDPNLLPNWESIIKALKNVQDTLSQNTIRSHQKTSAHESIGWVIDQVRAATSTSSRQLMHTPPQSSLSASQVTTGTPIDRSNNALENVPDSFPFQATNHKTPTQKAQDALDLALKYLNETYQGVDEKIKKGADPKTLVVEMPCSTFEEIGKKVFDARHYLPHHVTYSEDIGEHLNRLEKTIKETMTSTRKTWAQVAAAAAPSPEPDRIREI